MIVIACTIIAITVPKKYQCNNILDTIILMDQDAQAKKDGQKNFPALEDTSSQNSVWQQYVALYTHCICSEVYKTFTST